MIDHWLIQFSNKDIDDRQGRVSDPQLVPDFLDLQ